MSPGPDATLRPLYRSIADRRVLESPEAAAGPRPEVDLAALAFLFTGPGLLGEFAPTPWRGVETVWPLPKPAAAPLPVHQVFADVVEQLCADADAVGITMSGGLDSLAVVLHAAALRPRRRVIAFCTNLVDDSGVPAADVVRRLLAALAPDVELVVLDPAACSETPAWSPHGPRLDPLPAINAAVAALAADAGVGVLLSGNGADELLAIPRFAALLLLRARGVRAAARYLGDSRRSGPGWPGEAVAMLAGMLPTRQRTRWYWAANWPQWCAPSISPVVAEPWRQPALARAERWVTGTLTSHQEQRRGWAAADAYDSLWPRSYLPAAGTVPEASPFLHPQLVSAALAMPLTDRYDHRLPTAYQRCKAAVVGLLPPAAQPMLPTRKQYYRQALAAAVSAPVHAPLAVAAGLLDPSVLAAEELDTAVRMNVLAVESWLVGAYDAGVLIPGLKAQFAQRSSR
ncbi:asparagine synthase-related protein [Amycolatopsis sp. GM8]|uniref:asparagine synthase-related protein n=1 Tax=Amycolatopsis sp. GM8 TaxID=2896530 RepID=UPI001F0208F7|nr:asparagine synthase-related protein [Amycolatopsis sp. GM8]